MTTLITADLHFSATPRDAYRLQFLHKRLPALLKTYHVDKLYILGDMCEVKDQHGAVLVNQIVNGLASIAKIVSSVSILMGNHDFLQEGHPFFRFTQHIPNITYRDRPRRVGDHLFLPFTRTPEKDWKVVNFIGVKRIFTHMTFDGATGGFGRKLEGVSLDLLPEVPIISGDVHTPQKLDKLLTYVGAPYHIDFGDDYAGRVLLLDDKRVSSVVVGGPQKRLIKAPHLTGARSGDVVRVEVPIKAKDYSKWAERHEQIRKWAEETGVMLDSVVPVVIDASERAVDKHKMQKAIDDGALLTEYAKAKKIDERTLAIGREFL